MKRVAAAVVISLFIMGCENVDKDLHDQITYRTQEAPRRWNPERSIPVSGRRKDYGDVNGVTLASPFRPGAAAKSGEKLYGIYCAVCHGADGKSKTPVADKLDVRPFDLTAESARELADGEIFVKMLTSDTVMPSYRNELTDREAWQITAYVRRLQGKG